MNQAKTASSVLVNQDIWIEITPGQTNVSELLAQMNTAPAGIAVAVNNCIIPSGQWLNCSLYNNDKISIFGAIAGG